MAAPIPPQQPKPAEMESSPSTETDATDAADVVQLCEEVQRAELKSEAEIVGRTDSNSTSTGAAPSTSTCSGSCSGASSVQFEPFQAVVDIEDAHYVSIVRRTIPIPCSLALCRKCSLLDFFEFVWHHFLSVGSVVDGRLSFPSSVLSVSIWSRARSTNTALAAAATSSLGATTLTSERTPSQSNSG
jgi:hypothetical protein